MGRGIAWSKHAECIRACDIVDWQNRFYEYRYAEITWKKSITTEDRYKIFKHITYNLHDIISRIQYLLYNDRFIFILLIIFVWSKAFFSRNCNYMPDYIAIIISSLVYNKYKLYNINISLQYVDKYINKKRLLKNRYWRVKIEESCQNRVARFLSCTISPKNLTTVPIYSLWNY